MFPPFTIPTPVPKETAPLDKWRMVIDFRYLHSQKQDNRAPLPPVEDMLERHERQKESAVVDLKHGFHHMPLHPDDRQLMAMLTPLGTFWWSVLPMGVKHLPAQFLHLMEWILNHQTWPVVDDV